MGEFVGRLTELHHDERAQNVAIEHNNVIKRYYSSQIRKFVAQPLVLNDPIADRSMEENHKEAHHHKEEHFITESMRNSTLTRAHMVNVHLLVRVIKY